MVPGKRKKGKGRVDVFMVILPAGIKEKYIPIPCVAGGNSKEKTVLIPRSSSNHHGYLTAVRYMCALEWEEFQFLGMAHIK